MAGFGGKLMELFGQQPAPAQQSSADQNKTIPNSETQQNADGSGPVAIPKAGEGEKSPLENYSKLWEAPEKKEEKPPLYQIDNSNEKLQAGVKNLDFTKSVDPALLEKATKGDMGSMITVMNEVSKQTLAASTGTTAEIVKDAVKQISHKYENEIIPDLIRRGTISQDVAVDNPLLTDPAAKPLVDPLRNQFIEKYPTADATEIKKMMNEYLDGIMGIHAKARNKTITDTQNLTDGIRGGRRNVEQDWEKLLT